MDIISIIGAVVVASFSGYLFRLVIERFIDEDIIITKTHPLDMIPSSITYTFGVAIFLFIMAIAILVINFEGPF